MVPGSCINWCLRASSYRAWQPAHRHTVAQEPLQGVLHHLRTYSSFHSHSISPEMAGLRRQQSSERELGVVGDRQLYRHRTCALVLGMADWTPHPMSPAMSGLCGGLVVGFAASSVVGSGPGQDALQSAERRRRTLGIGAVVCRGRPARTSSRPYPSTRCGASAMPKPGPRRRQGHLPSTFRRSQVTVRGAAAESSRRHHWW